MGETSRSTSSTIEDQTLESRVSRRAAVLQRGTTIGRYVVLQQIGRGGMGVVHAAYDPQLDRKIAIKVMVPRKRRQEAGRQRLLREAQAMARVSHPNVVAVHDVGVHAEQVFVAMDFVEGFTLTQWLGRQDRTEREIVDVFVQAGQGLTAAHAKGLVHRDFKPDNVMVDGHGRAQVMDFGLVRALEVGSASRSDGLDLDDEPDHSSGSQSSGLTRAGQRVGTPAYMAPEQYDRAAVDARTDQFSFCVALWEALAGVHPFGDDPKVLAKRIASGTRQELPSATRVSRRVRRALDRGLRPNMEERWPSMDPLLAELDHDPARQRRRLLIGTAVLTAVALAVGTERALHARSVAACEREGASIEDTWGEPGRQRVHEGMLASGLPRATTTHARLIPWLDRYTKRWRDARTVACLGTEVDEHWTARQGAASVECLEQQRADLAAFVDVLTPADAGAIDEAVFIAADLAAPESCVDERFLAHQTQVPADPDTRASHRAMQAKLSRAWSLHAARRRTQAIAAIEELRPLIEELAPSGLRVRALRLHGAMDQAAGRWEAAETEYREAFAMALELGTAELAGDLAHDLARLVGQDLGRHDNGLWWADVAAGLYRRLGEDDQDLRMLGLIRARATIWRARGDIGRAQTLAERALVVAEANLGADHPRLATDLRTLALVHMDLNELDQAERLARRSIASRERSLGPAHPRVAAALGVLGDVLRLRGELDQALEVQRRALATWESALPATHPDIARGLINLAILLQQRGQSEEARPLLERAASIAEGSFGPEHQGMVAVLINIGNVQQSLGDLQAAHRAYLRSLEIVDRLHGPDHPTRGIALSNAANTEIMLGRHDEALAHQREALAIFEKAFGPRHPNVGTALINLAEAHQLLGQPQPALETYQRARAVLEAAHDADHPDVAYALIGIAQAHLSAGNPEEALAPATRALALRSSHDVAPQELAYARWILARALRANDLEPERVRTLATRAREVIGPDDQELRAFIEALGDEPVDP